MSTERTRQPLPLPRPIAVVLRPFQRFFETESAGGILLLLATAAALVWANSRFGDTYHRLLDQQIAVQAFGGGLAWPLHRWINDALMAVFFFLVGMEIKRELVLGELRSLGRASLPAIAALGGMLVPALIFTAFNAGTPGIDGWGVPVATDIAFALGALAMLGSRVPASLAIFLTALAIFDDLGAIVVIALFYGHGLDLTALLAAGGVTLVLVLMNLFGVRRIWPYLAVGIVLWAEVLASGIHATIAGVILGLCIPARTRRDPAEISSLSARLAELSANIENERLPEDAISAVTGYLSETQSPLDRLVGTLHPWVAFLIIPVFALANAGVELGALQPRDLLSPVPVGVALGLFLGKQAGIFGATWLAIRLRLSPLPTGASWSQLYGVAVLGGIGFTMSLFISTLAFPNGSPLNEQAKIGILIGSAISAVAGYLFLRYRARPRAPEQASVERTGG